MKPTKKLSSDIAALNEICFDGEDEYNDARRVEGCDVYFIRGVEGVVAYALLKPGRIASLERYGVKPGFTGKGFGRKVLKKALAKYKAVSTYASGSAAASCAVLTKVGFNIIGTGDGWVYFMYLRNATR